MSEQFQVPAYLARRQSRGLADGLAASISSGAVPHLSIKGSRFTLVDATGNERNAGKLDDQGLMYIDVVIADSNDHTSRVYYEQKFDPNASDYAPPTCFSDNGSAPSSQAQVPQAKFCASCPNAVWNSAVSPLTGKGKPACNEVQKLAIVIPGTEMLFLLRVPPGSLKWLGKYVREVGSFSLGGRKADLPDVVTRISFAKDAIGVLNFKAVSLVDEPTAMFCDKALEAHAADTIVGKLDRPYTGETVAMAPARETAELRAIPPPAPRQAPEPEKPIYTAPVGRLETPAANEPPPPRPRGRPKKEAVQEERPTQAPFMKSALVSTISDPTTSLGGGTKDDDLELPNFLRRTDAGSAPKAPAEKFGMVADAEEPPNEMARMIADAMRLPT